MSIDSPDATNVAATGSDAIASAEPANTGATTSMEDTIREAYRAQKAAPEAGDTDTGEAETAGRQRGPDGKFAKAAGAEEVPLVEGQEGAEITDPTATAAVEPKPHDAAPNTWKKELGAEFSKLPENVRQEIHRREQDFHRGIGQYKEAAGFGQQLAQEMLPYQQDMQQNSIHPRDVVKTLLPAWKTLATGTQQDKANLVLQLVKDYGIDFTSLGTDPPQGTAQTTEVHPEVAALKRELGEIKGSLTAQERIRAEAEYNAHVESVNKFGSDPKHEHFAAVRQEMAKLIESGQAIDMDDAYDKAIWINPEVRKSLLAKQEKERANKAATEAAAARKAAGANVTRRGTPPVQQAPGSMEDTIRQTYRRMNGA